MSQECIANAKTRSLSVVRLAGITRLAVITRLAFITTGFFLFCLLCATHAVAETGLAFNENDERWNIIRQQLFEDRTIEETGNAISLNAPGRAFDAARVPVTLRALSDQTPDNFIRKLYLIVDKNPVPVAGTFTFEPNNGWQTIDTELRVNEYSYMRVVAEMNTGELHMATHFIKAIGGCSAPPSSYDRSDQSRFGVFEASITNLLDPKVPALARIRIIHPNASGMQFDQMSRTYIPAHYIHTMAAEFNDQPIFKLDTNFSLSQDPVLGFNFEPSEKGTLKIYAIDSKKERFQKTWDVSNAVVKN